MVFIWSFKDLINSLITEFKKDSCTVTLHPISPFVYPFYNRPSCVSFLSPIVNFPVIYNLRVDFCHLVGSDVTSCTRKCSAIIHGWWFQVSSVNCSWCVQEPVSLNRDHSALRTDIQRVWEVSFSLWASLVMKHSILWCPATDYSVFSVTIDSVWYSDVSPVGPLPPDTFIKVYIRAELLLCVCVSVCSCVCVCVCVCCRVRQGVNTVMVSEVWRLASRASVCPIVHRSD